MKPTPPQLDLPFGRDPLLEERDRAWASMHPAANEPPDGFGPSGRLVVRVHPQSSAALEKRR